MLKDIIKHNLGAILLGILALILYFNGCFKPTPSVPTITIVRDTVWVYHDSTIHTVPTVVVVKPPTSIPPIYLPDTNTAKLLAQYNKLLQEHFSQKIVTDTLHIDTIGTVSTIDTLQHNDLVGRKWSYHIKERQITNTITITQPYKSRNQVYVGGGFETIPNTSFINQVDAGLAFKNKRDIIIQGLGTYDLNEGRWGIQVGIFKLIRLKHL